MYSLATQRRNPPEVRSRRGGAILLTIVSLSLFVSAVALATDLAMIAYASRQMHCACAAAALAGAGDLLEEPHVFAGAWSAPPTPDVARVALARDRARQYAWANAVDASPLGLEPLDAVCGWIDEPQRIGRPLAAWEGSGPVNALEIHGQRTRKRGASIAYWFGSFLGLKGADLDRSARATLDQRIYGFRPHGHVRVPLVPIVIDQEQLLGDGDAQRRAEQGAAPTSQRLEGSAAALRIIDVAQRRTSAAKSVRAGGEAPSGASVRTGADADTDSGVDAWIVRFDSAPARQGDAERQMVEGLGAWDLAEQGGQIALTDQLRLPQVSDEAALQALRSAIGRIAGEKRIWMLGARDVRQGTCRITGFCAGRIVSAARPRGAAHASGSGVQRSEADGLGAEGLDAEGLGGGGVEIEVEACGLATSTALVGPQGRYNPWLGKVMLSH